MCIAYIDPGNLEADLQTGAGTGYRLLWVLLYATLIGYLMQTLATRLGVATEKHLAQHCRDEFHAAPRILLWLMCELAIIGSDIQARPYAHAARLPVPRMRRACRTPPRSEVIGTAIALLLLTGGACPLWAGVLFAAVAGYALLLLERAGLRWLELGMIAVMGLSMGYLYFAMDIPRAAVLKGLLIPRLTRSAIPTACGLLGAVVMPHNLYLHSALVQSGRMGEGELRPCRRERLLYHNIEAGAALAVTLFINTCVISADDIGLENAGAYLGREFGPKMALIWAVGLLAAGQSSVITGTFAGQFAMSGFLNLKARGGVCVSAFARTLITRGVAICPTLVVAWQARADSTPLDDLNQWLNILQAVQLPFAIIPPRRLRSPPRRRLGKGRRRRGRLQSGAAAAPAGACRRSAASRPRPPPAVRLFPPPPPTPAPRLTSTAYDTAMAHLAPARRPLFFCGAAGYLGFIAYLMAAPVGSAVRHLGSTWSLAGSAWSLPAVEEGLLGEARAAAGAGAAGAGGGGGRGGRGAAGGAAGGAADLRQPLL
eukprot:scaffold4.g4922.t1